MVNKVGVVHELIAAAPGRIAMSAPKALTDDVIAMCYVAVVPICDITLQPSKVDQRRAKKYSRPASLSEAETKSVIPTFADANPSTRPASPPNHQW